MNDRELMPGQGIPGLRLGDNIAAVRERFGEPRIFRRTSDAPEMTDYFASSGMLVTYGQDQNVTSIEMTHPSNPTIRGVPLLGRPLIQVLDDLAQAGISAATDNDGAVIAGWRVGLYAPSDVNGRRKLISCRHGGVIIRVPPTVLIRRILEPVPTHAVRRPGPAVTR